jgi:hypothetical protein
MEKSLLTRQKLPQHNLLYRRKRLQPLLRDPSLRRLKVREILQRIPESFYLKDMGERGVGVALDASPGAAKRCLVKNEKFIGVSRYRKHYNVLKFLALLITVNGTSLSVVKQMNYLYGYLRKGKPHGFSKHINSVAKSLWLLA